MPYPKLNKDDKCAFKERKICNYCDCGCGLQRCIYMKYDRSKSIYDSNRWHCTYLHNPNIVKEKE